MAGVQVQTRTVTVSGVPERDGQVWPDGKYVYLPDMIESLLSIGMIHKIDLSNEVAQLKELNRA